MIITVIHYSFEIDRMVIENMRVNPQTPQELDGILRDAGVAMVSDEQAAQSVDDGALDLRKGNAMDDDLKNAG